MPAQSSSASSNKKTISSGKKGNSSSQMKEIANEKEQFINEFQPTSKQKVATFLSSIQQKIAEELEQNKSQVSNKQIPFYCDKFLAKAQQDQKQLKRLSNQKKTTELKLKALTEKQFEYQFRHRENQKEKRKGFLSQRMGYQIGATTASRISNIQEESDQNILKQSFIQPSSSRYKTLKLSRSTNRIRPKSQLTKQDIETLKRLKQQHKQFQKLLVEKTAAFQESIQKIKQEDQELKEKRKNQKNQIKRKQLEAKLSEIEIKRKKQIEQFQEENKKLAELKRKPKLFAEWSKQFQDRQKSFEQSKVEKMKNQLKRKLVDMSSLSDHQKQYNQAKQQHRQQVTRKWQQQNQMLMKSKLDIEKSRFYKNTINLQRQNRIQRRQRQQSPTLKADRMKQYAKKVNLQYAPRLKTKSDDEDVDDQGSRSRKFSVYQDKSMTDQERRQAGNEYLKIAIKSLKQQNKQRSAMTSAKSSKQSTTKSTTKSTNLPKLSTRYKDYLTESMKFRSSHGIDREKYQQKIYQNRINEVRNIMANQYNEKTKYASVQKIKDITDKLEPDPNDKNFLRKIEAKLKILETIT